jgi:hypothetical protein
MLVKDEDLRFFEGLPESGLNTAGMASEAASTFVIPDKTGIQGRFKNRTFQP